MQKEIAEGIEYARRTYNLDVLPNVIVRKVIAESGALGEYSETYKELRLRPSLKVDEAFATAVHEMAHFADQQNGGVSSEIVKQAMKELGFKAGTRKYQIELQKIALPCGDNPFEAFAYSLEHIATNRAGAISKRIFELWIERIGEK